MPTALDFPASPTLGQQHPSPVVTGQPVYKWDGGRWVSLVATGKAYVPLDGTDPMTGLLTLSGAPTADLHAATKKFVADSITAIPPPVLPGARGYLAGLTLSMAPTSTTFSITSGIAANSTAVAMMILATALSKTTNSWAVGNSNGALDTGTIVPSVWYHVYLIRRPDTDVVDICISTNPNTPTIVASPPTGGFIPNAYTQFRRIGSMLTNSSSQWTVFTQLGDEFMWASPPTDVNTTTFSGATTLFPLTVPNGIQVRANIRGAAANATVATAILIFAQDEFPATAAASTGYTTAIAQAGGVNQAFGPCLIRTTTNREVRATANAASTTLRIATIGWIDTRGKDA